MPKTTMKGMMGWCLIPPAILSREDISDSQKLLMGRILGLLNKDGYCFASNAWLGNQMNLKRIRVSQLLSDLQKKGLLEIKLIRDGNRFITKRKIFPVISQTSNVIENDNTCYKKVKGVLSKSDRGCYRKVIGVLSESDIPLLSKSEKIEIEIREIENRTTHQISKKSDFQEFIDFYFKEYREKFKTAPPFKGGRDGKTVKTLLKVMTVDILKTTVSRYLETEDLFFRKNGYDIPRFEKFLDGLKCGAFGTEESRPYSVSKSQKNSTEEYSGHVDFAGNPMQVLRSRDKKEEEDDVIIDPSTGNPAKTIVLSPKTRKTIQEKFREGLL